MATNRNSKLENRFAAARVYRDAIPQTTMPARPHARASRAVRSPMHPSSRRPPLSITRTSHFCASCIASRNTSTLPKCFAGRARPATRLPPITGEIPGGAMRSESLSRKAASAINGVESWAKLSARNWFFTFELTAFLSRLAEAHLPLRRNEDRCALDPRPDRI